MHCFQIEETSWQEVFLIGGGPSVKGFDFDRLRGRTVVAINDVIKSLPWATAVFTADRNWYENRQRELREFEGEKYLAILPGKLTTLAATYLERSREPGLSTDPRKIHINGNSGYGALNLAFLKGAKKIYLLGYDFTKPGKNWHDGYPWAAGMVDETVFQQWADAFDEARPFLFKSGVQVFNTNPMSRIQAFQKIRLDDLPKGEAAA